MRVLIQEMDNGIPDSVRRIRAVVDGVEALGWEAIVWRGSRVAPADVDFGIVRGMRQTSRLQRDYLKSIGKPYLVLDLGYMKRTQYGAVEADSYYYQLGWNKIGWVPAQAMPPDRFSRLGIDVVDKRSNKNRRNVLLAGQMAMDAQHGLTMSELNGWLAAAYKEVAKPGDVPVYRPHPRDATGLIPRLEGMLTQKGGPLSKALEEARLVVTYNSTLGVEALIEDVPLKCCPKAHYAEVCGAPLKERLAYLHRLSYAQWTLDEFRSGEALQFLVQHMDK